MGRPRTQMLRAAIATVVLFSVTLWAGCSTPAEEAARPSAPPPSKTENALLARFSDAERQLHSVDSEVRRNAAIALLSMGSDRALRAVKETVQETDEPQVKVDLIQAIEFTRDHRCFSILLELVDDPSPMVRKATGDALANFTRHEEIRAMIELVKKEPTSDRTRRLLFEALSDGFAFGAVPVLIEGLESSTATTQQAAWEALKRISGRSLPAEPQAWREWWETNRIKNREEILEEQLRDHARREDALKEELEGLQDRFDELLRVARSAENGKPGVLLQALDSEHDRIRRYAAFRLANLDTETLNLLSLDQQETYNALKTALDSESREIRRDVMSVIARLNGSARRDLVRRALGDQDPQVLLKAIEGISQTPEEEAIKRLIELLRAHEDPPVREAAANALGKAGAQEATSALVGALDDPAENVRWFAVEGLRKLSAKDALPRLSDVLLNDESARVREITASTLGELGQPAAIPALRKALADENERVRSKAANALQALADGELERMSIIADNLINNDFPHIGADVLRKALEKFGGQEELKDQVISVRKKLAALLKKQQDFAGAASQYLKLEEATGGNPEIRRQLIDCWLAADSADKLVSQMPVWLEGAQGDDLERTVTLGCDAARGLIETEQTQQAGKLLTVLADAARKAQNETLQQKVNEVQERLGE